MTREEIIELAQEAQTHDPGFSVWILSTPHLERIVNRAVEAERKAILEHCEAMRRAHAGYQTPPGLMQLIDAIRARGSK
jgi:hypothetical protein